MLDDFPITLRVPGGVQAPSAARRAVRGHLAGRLPQECVEDVLLLVSELVTNGVRHADVGEQEEIRIDLDAGHGTVRVAVTDPGSQLEPAVQPADPARPGGMGLLLVDRISERWGVDRDDDRWTRVWFEVARPAA